jgi:hypothetical protein
VPDIASSQNQTAQNQPGQNSMGKPQGGWSQGTIPQLISSFQGGPAAAAGGADIASGAKAIAAFQNGGDPDPNKPALVGENGPELIVPKIPTSVIPMQKPLGPEPPPMSMGSMGGLPPLPTSGLKPIVTNPQDQLRQQLQQKVSQYDNPQPAQGFWGKLGHALAQTGLVQNSGTMVARRAQEGQREKELAGLQEQQLAQQKQANESGLQNAQAGYYGAHAQSLEPHIVTPDEAAAMNMPGLAGSAMDPKSWEQIIKQAGVNTTKVDTTTATNQSREKVADMNALNKTQPHITAMLNGQPHIMERDPQTKQYSIDRGIAPPSYAQVAPTLQRNLWAIPDGQGNYTAQEIQPGQTIPAGSLSMSGVNSLYQPTGQEKTAAGRAQIALKEIPNIVNELQTNPDQFGPIMGRWNDFYQGKIGLDNPTFAHLHQQMMMAATSVAMAHAIGRLPENLRQEFDDAINSPHQTPENLIAVLRAVQPWMEDMASMAEPGFNQGVARGSAPPTPAKGGGNAPPAGATPVEGSTKTNAAGIKVKFTGGKWVAAQ